MVLLVAATLVFGIGKLLGGVGSDEPADRASTAASTPTGSATPTRSRAPLGPVAVTKIPATSSTAPLLPPTGECADDEVSVLPSVPVAEAGKPIVLHLRLVGTQPACTFTVSPETMVVKITSGKDRIWSSQDCQHAIKKSAVVVRSGVPADVPVTWSGRRSDSDCSSAAAWAMPGFYHVFAAALGSTPTDVQFEITYPKRGIVTKTAKPKPSRKASATASPKASPRPR